MCAKHEQNQKVNNVGVRGKTEDGMNFNPSPVCFKRTDSALILNFFQTNSIHIEQNLILGD